MERPGENIPRVIRRGKTFEYWATGFLLEIAVFAIFVLFLALLTAAISMYG